MNTDASHHHRGNRVEDFRLITGAGKYAADWNAPGQLYGFFVRAVRAREMPIKLPRRIPVGRVFSGAGDETEILYPVAAMVMGVLSVHYDCIPRNKI